MNASQQFGVYSTHLANLSRFNIKTIVRSQNAELIYSELERPISPLKSPASGR